MTRDFLLGAAAGFGISFVVFLLATLVASVQNRLEARRQARRDDPTTPTRGTSRWELDG